CSMRLLELASKRLRLALRNAQRIPLASPKMFRQQDDLVNVAGIMQQLPGNGLHHRVLPAGNEYRSAQVLSGERDHCSEHALPPVIPQMHDIGASRTGIDLELSIPMTIGLI